MVSISQRSFAGVQKLGRALMLPIAVLPVAGILLRLGQPDLLNIGFIAEAGNAIFHKAWDGSAWLPSTTGWESLGGLATGEPHVVAWGPNRLDIVVKGPGNVIYHKAWNGAAWLPSPTDWESLGGIATSEPQIVSWGPNRLDLYMRGTDGGLYHKWYDGVKWQPGTADWENLGK